MALRTFSIAQLDVYEKLCFWKREQVTRGGMIGSCWIRGYEGKSKPLYASRTTLAYAAYLAGKHKRLQDNHPKTYKGVFYYYEASVRHYYCDIDPSQMFTSLKSIKEFIADFRDCT